MSNLFNETNSINPKDLDYLIGVISLMLINYENLDEQRKAMTVNMVLRLGLGRSTTKIVVPKHDDLITKTIASANKRILPTPQRKTNR